MTTSTGQSLFSLPLGGKLAIVTGASRGIGADLAWELARRGANVCLTYLSDNSRQNIVELRAKIGQLPHKPTTWACQVDLSKTTGAQGVVALLQEDYAKSDSSNSLAIDILVNNAGFLCTGSIHTATVEDYDTVFSLNVRGTMLMTQAVIPSMPRNGRIINLSSVGARAGFKDVCLYSASKAAIEGFTRCWASELGANGTTVNAVAPGPVPSDMLDDVPKAIIEMQKEATPIEQRLGTTQEIANIVGWLAGPESSWVTGQVISASGGWTMY